MAFEKPTTRPGPAQRSWKKSPRGKPGMRSKPSANPRSRRQSPSSGSSDSQGDLEPSFGEMLLDESYVPSEPRFSSAPRNLDYATPGFPAFALTSDIRAERLDESQYSGLSDASSGTSTADLATRLNPRTLSEKTGHGDKKGPGPRATRRPPQKGWSGDEGGSGEKPRPQGRPRASYPTSIGPEEMLSVSRQCLENRDFIMISLDLEMFEKQTSVITEIGISVVNQGRDQSFYSPRYHTFHLIPTENQSKRNGRFVPDNRDTCTRAVSNMLPMDDCREFFHRLVEHFKAISKQHGRPLYFVGHSVKGDLDLMLNNSFKFDTSIPYLDTSTLWSHWFGKAETASLASILDTLGIQARFLHNAANDAHATLEALLTMCDPQFRDYYNFEMIARETRRIADLERRAKFDPELAAELENDPGQLLLFEELQCRVPRRPKLKGKQKIRYDSHGYVASKSLNEMLVEMTSSLSSRY